MEAAFLGFIQKQLLSFLKEQLKYLLDYEKNVGELDKGVKDLKKERDELRHRVEEDENRYGKEIEPYITDLLKEADEKCLKCDEFLRSEDRANAGCTNGFLPNPGIRYSRSKDAEVFTKEVNGLVQQLQTIKHDKISYHGFPPSMGVALLSNVDYQEIEPRTETMAKIRKELEDSSVRMIGVHGLTGVGKTTLVIEVAKKAQRDNLFKVVILANVTSSPDIRKLQGQIADGLGIKLDEESEDGRAVRIRKRLMKEKENILIILDDLWAKLDINLLGIPSDNDDGSQKNVKEGKSPMAQNRGKSEQHASDYSKRRTEKSPVASNKKKTEETLSRYKGCKIVLISETIQVLLSQMNGERNLIFSVEPLQEKEAETLFEKIIDIRDEDSRLKKLAAQIARKCNGLPMTIVTTARALKNEGLGVWEDVNRRLEGQKLAGAPEFSIRLSYDHLENEELKYTFLLCARMGHDALIVDLVKYCIGLGFLQRIYTVREARNRIQALLVKLKESSLLSDSYSSDCFTMQDIVRGAALSIASKQEDVFMMTKERLDEWPDDDKLERYTAISLHHCVITEKFPERINCPRLRVFHVDNNGSRLKIPDGFFNGMKELRVLILTGFQLSPLPSSFKCLTRLRMLCLERCMLGENLSFIGELRNLRILSLLGSHIEKLPAQLGHLAKLQIFDISNCSKLRVIPPNVLSSLTSLEELYMRKTSIQWKDEGQGNQSENASLSELRHLNQLTTLDIQIPDVALLPKNLFFDKLNSYKIVIGDLNAYLERDFKMPEKYEAPKFLALQLKDGFDIHSQKGIKMLFGRVENLLLGEVNGVQDIFYELNLKGFPYLKHLTIVSNSDIKSIVNSKGRQLPEKAFPKLESLCLYKLKNMEQICYTKLTNDSFCSLKIIKIKLCGQLKNIFLFSMVGLRTALETIEVSECNSLKEIVVVEMQNNAEKIKFPGLRSLTLQSLSKFIGFCTILPSTEQQGQNWEPRELFDEKVEVPELERMELSSIKIKKIWSDKPLQSSYFGKLILLDVTDCGDLQYLFSISIAKSLVNLQSLFVSECEMMENIFNKEEVSKDPIFPKLKNIKLSSMKKLESIWHSKVVFSDYFSMLDTLIIEECEKLVHVFPHQMVGRFGSLCNLRVTNCKSMNNIFDLEGDGKTDAGDETNLQSVHFEALPKLKHVWNKDPKGILKFEKLRKIWVHKCPILKNIFQFSVANGLKQLEYLMVWDCGLLEEIVAKKEGSSVSSRVQFEFPELTTIKLSELPELQSFYPGDPELILPALSNLSVELCDKLKPFRAETTDSETEPVSTKKKEERKPVLPEKVIYTLKSMQLESRDAKWLKSYIRNCRMDKLEELHLSRLVNTEILYFFLHMNPSLKSLWLNNCFFDELVPDGRPPEIGNLGVVPMLKSLKLIDLPLLKNIGFERDTVLQRIESLIVQKCPCLITIVPSSVSFIHLTTLEVISCNRLINVMAPSTAKSLVQLNTMKVIKCDLVKEIVSEQGNEDEENAGKIVFRQLKVLELVSLPKLTTFCSSKSCSFVFQSLEKLVVSACPSLENFSEKVKSTPILRQIYFVHQKKDQRLYYWAGDINATIQKMFNDKVFFEGMDEVAVSDPVDLNVWVGEIGLRDSLFLSLKTLKLENCNFQSHAIASNILPYLKNLKELLVWNCSNMKVIFDINDTAIDGMAFLLKKLYLDGLPNLTHVWDNNRQGILSFQNLQEVLVTNCENLKTVFPAALAKNLKKLEKLDISDCKELLEIVGKEEVASEATEKFVFPRLTSLDLFMLPQLSCFYPERFILECPELNNLHVLFCGKLEPFQSHQQAHPEGQASTSANGQPLFLDQNIIIPKLEALTLNWKGTTMIWNGQFQADILHKLKQLQLCFDDVNEVSNFPFEFLQKVPNLEFLLVSRCCGLKEIFPPQELKIGEDSMLGHLEALYLLELLELQSIGLENTWLTRFCDQLRSLIVVSCPCLTTLVNSVVSFSYLKELIIANCDGLKYLFTSSTAEKLMHLEDMYILQCESMKEIFAEEQSEITLDKIKLRRLDTIYLYSLPSLVCFYSGNATLKLPSLIQMVVCQCPKMNFFSQGPIHAKSFRGIQVSLDSYDDLVNQGDLKVTIERRFLREEHLVLGDHPKLEEIWLDKEQVPDGSFSNLKSLVVEGCEFLSNAVLPCHLLPFLSNLEELKVGKCNFVDAIFDVKDAPTHHTEMTDMERISPLSLCFRKLILEQLPILKHVWNDDPQGSLHLPFLEEVLVDGCDGIQSLFPASVAKDKLQKLHVQNCEALVEIVAKDEAATEEAIEELIVFPSLTSLSLLNLPNLKCIYPGMQNLDWPMLKELNVYHCQMLKIFATEFQSCPDSHPEGGFVSVEKVIPHLEQLSLNKEDAMRIEKGQLHVDFQELKFLKLQCFHDVSDVFPYSFLSKVLLPSVEKLGVVDNTFKEIFPSQRPDIDYTAILSQLKGLELINLSMLNSVGLEHSWMGPFSENLETLAVLTCSCLENLVPSTVSFSHLTQLTVEGCDGLKYLFTSSTAKSLDLLNKMHVANCVSMEEIVAEEEDEPEGEMVFKQLKILSLNLLPKLGSFYKGSSTLNFPSLEQVSLTQCHSMIIFCHGDVVHKKLQGQIDGVYICGDLNTAIKRQWGRKQPELV